ncbi:sigma-70 family RNA polymerase sigma factor [Dyadobacter flavalbus]|uniref:Sigma-70 family RNA polymerase sigma factor n=2 Tax=Dyadobacter flavalbus TaxID=2579942 RepID=A0A5M8QAQ2_9BACT|nr:sigma-70 family RNA polymerase sigma factor [Dyadobacter flavalbus]
MQLLGALYQPYMEMVYAVCYTYLREENESKDAVMQIFEKIVTDLRTHEVDNFKSWLHTVARNFCLMQIRKKKVFVTAEEVSENLSGFADEDYELYDNADLKRTALDICMKALAKEQRAAIELFYMQEKCYREISAETGFDLNKVKSCIQNGKRNLKICMDKNGRA